MTNTGAIHKCDRDTPHNVRTILKPSCLELLHKQVVITSEDFDARVTCGNEASKKMHMPIGTVITGHNCTIEGSPANHNTWALQNAEESVKGQNPMFIQNPSYTYNLLGVKMQVKDMIIIALATISVLVSLALGLLYFTRKKQEQETALQAYEREVAYQQRGYPIANI